LTTTNLETLDAVLRRRAAELPDHVAYRYLGDGETESEQFTYAALDRQARAIAVRLLALGQPGQPVLLMYEGGLKPLAAFFGCLYAGMIAVPVAPPRPRQPLDALAAIAADAAAGSAATACVVLTSQALLARYQHDPALEHLHWLATDTIGADDPDAAAWQPPNTRPDDTAALLYTSGSTSQPKGVMLSHKSLWGPPFDLPAGIDPDWTLNAVAWMPQYHIAGLTFSLLVLRVGRASEIRLPAELVVEQPLLWLRAISRYRALQAGGPNFLYQLCVDRIAPEDRAGLDLGLWMFATCVSEPVRAETLEQFAAAYADAGFQPWAFVPNYGLSEQAEVSGRAGPRLPKIVAFDQAALAQNQVVAVTAEAAGAMRLVSNGPPGPGVTLRIVDPATGTACAPGQVGEVWTASAYMSAGYWRKPEASAETFQAHLASGEGPFLRTGDLGFIYEEELYICGRLKDMIIIRGQNYYVQDIEAAAAGSHPDLGGAAAAFAVPAAGEAPERVVIYHEVRPECATPDVPAISAAIRRAVARQLQLQVYAVVLVAAGGLPRTGVGKVRRYLVREEFLAQQATPAGAEKSAGREQRP
jgi:acyl-CoA synthetase (AMP-forming)/AMP-acid ligase II